jgi:hypothetical protein
VQFWSSIKTCIKQRHTSFTPRASQTATRKVPPADRMADAEQVSVSSHAQAVAEVTRLVFCHMQCCCMCRQWQKEGHVSVLSHVQRVAGRCFVTCFHFKMSKLVYQNSLNRLSVTQLFVTVLVIQKLHEMFGSKTMSPLSGHLFVAKCKHWKIQWLQVCILHSKV